MDDNELVYEVKNKVGIITINRPAVLNSLSVTVYNKLDDIWNQVDEDKNVSVIVITSSGEKAFCAGMDLKEQAKLSREGRDILEFIKDPMMNNMRKVQKPIIAAINGVAFAGGFLLAQNADIRIASINASFAISESKVGRGSPWAVPLLWTLPQNICNELTMTGEPLNADRMYELGFVNKLVEPDELMNVTLKVAKRISNNAPLSVLTAKQVFKEGTELGLEEGLQRAYELYEKVYASEDAIEGPKAFAEKREPEWKGY